MKTFIILLIMVSSAPCWAGNHSVSIVCGPATGAEDPASGTVLLGTETTSTSESAGIDENSLMMYDLDIEASWAASASTATAGTGGAYVSGWQAGYGKLVITDSSGAIITNGVSSPVATPEFGVTEWMVFTFPTPPTLTKGTNYRIGIICNAFTNLQYNNSGTVSLVHDTANSYTTPETFSLTSNDDSTTTFSGMYVKH